DRNVTGVQTCALPISEIPRRGALPGVSTTDAPAILRRAWLTERCSSFLVPARSFTTQLPEPGALPAASKLCTRDMPQRCSQMERSEERRVGKGGRAEW